MSCDAGHTKHTSKPIDLILDGPTKLTDVPEIVPRLRRHLRMEVYDWQKYFKTERNNEVVPIYDKYCPGQDVVSYALDRQGVWEGYETAAVLDILSEQPTGTVVDVGAHIGYYSLLAGTGGYDVLAYETNESNLKLLEANVNQNCPGKVVIVNQWVDEKTPRINDINIHLFKCDIEGSEKHAIKMIEKPLRQKMVKYLLLEISPVFNDSYPYLVEKICNYGYRVYQIPGKGWEHTKDYAEQPITALKQYCEIPKVGRKGYVRSLHQENFLFIRNEQ